MKSSTGLAQTYLRRVPLPGDLASLLWRDLAQGCVILSHRLQQGRSSAGLPTECEPHELELLGSELLKLYRLPKLESLLAEFGASPL